MKKLLILSILLLSLAAEFCTSSKKIKGSGKETAKITYHSNIQPLIAGKCSPCHIPPEGNKKAYNTYAAVKSDIDEILTRVQRNPGEKGFMPAKHPKLSDSTIQVIMMWKKDGMAE